MGWKVCPCNGRGEAEEGGVVACVSYEAFASIVWFDGDDVKGEGGTEDEGDVVEDEAVDIAGTRLWGWPFVRGIGRPIGADVGIDMVFG